MHKPVFILIVFAVFAAWSRPAPAEKEVPSGAYPEELPGAFTGGFGEESCHSCHFDFPLNPQKASLQVEDLPDRYRPGKAYIFTVAVRRSDLGQGGFQISSRFPDGVQAGSFRANSNRLDFTPTVGEVQYLQHASTATYVHNQDSLAWKVRWEAPKSSTGPVIFNIAANAANGDASAFGDYIYVQTFTLNMSAD